MEQLAEPALATRLHQRHHAESQPIERIRWDADLVGAAVWIGEAQQRVPGVVVGHDDDAANGLYVGGFHARERARFSL